MIRSKIKYCTIIWRPVSESESHKFQTIQKSGINWILNEGYTSYSNKETYLKKCKEVY